MGWYIFPGENFLYPLSEHLNVDLLDFSWRTAKLIFIYISERLFLELGWSALICIFALVIKFTFTCDND